MLQRLRQESGSASTKKEELPENIEVKPEIIEEAFISEPNTSKSLALNERGLEESTKSQNDVITNLADLQNRIKELTEGTTCKVCGKEFFNKKALKVHVETHIEGLIYGCNHCNTRYSSSNALRAHYYRCPMQENKTVPLKSIIISKTAPVWIPNNEKKEESPENVEVETNFIEDSPEDFEETKPDHGDQ